MSIYYQNELVTLFHGDCLEQRDWLDCDVLVTDPPYGMSFQSNFRKDKTQIFDVIVGDDSTIIRDLALDLWGSEKASIVFGTWRQPKPAMTKVLGIWNKGESAGMGDLSIPFGINHEEIYIYGKKGFFGKRTNSIFTIPTIPSTDLFRPNHPTPKPVQLMSILIEKTHGTIADPFAGSGATLVAANNLGRKAVGVELEEKYCEMIAKRLDQLVFDF